MTGEQWARIAALFDTICERPPAERDAWLREHAGDDTTRAEVVTLLRAYDADPDFLEPAPDTGHRTEGPARHLIEALAPSLVGRRVGAYRLTAEIGRGGMGIVYAAERDDAEFDRRAAIKILPSWSAAPLAERFRFERRVLAALDHPGIARLLDAGSTEDGVPYFVMELVEGEAIDAWCRTRGAGVRERVTLVERVCDAVAYAHQRLVIHRDLKAANIFVTADGTPKLLDFGIATLLDDEGVAAAGRTRTGHHSFTPEYASPEQIRGERVTTASDVYSLGVVLYRLLADRPPYDLAGLSPLDAMRVACEADPPPMSSVADPARRGTLRGDIDRIVAKSLRKAPAERYGTIAELAADLRAWLDGRPVSAAPQSLVDRVRRGVRRHRGAVAAGAALFVTLVAGVVGTSWQARVAARERDKAQHRFREVQQVSRALLFDVHDALRRLPGATEPRRLLLDRAVTFMDGLAADAADDHQLQLELSEGYRRLGQVQGLSGVDNLGDTAAAVASFEKAARLAEDARRGNPAALRPLVAAFDAWSDIASTADELGRDDQGARAHARRLALLSELGRRPDDVETSTALAISHSTVGVYHAGRQEPDQARVAYVAALAHFDRLPAAVRTAQVRPYSLTLKSLGAIEMVRGALDDSERHYRSALALEDAALRQTPSSPRWPFEISFTLSDLGLIMTRRGRNEEARPLWRRALDIRRRALAADPKNVRMLVAVASMRSRLGHLDLQAKRYADAIAGFEENLAINERLVAAQPASTSRLAEREWTLLLLAKAHAEAAASGDRAWRASGPQARALLARVRPERVAVAGKTDAGFRKEYDALAGQLQAPPAPRQ
jgi:non-specific serine/threonine protein kinase/serine/threonine-protein kinase